MAKSGAAAYEVEFEAMELPKLLMRVCGNLI
jgi:hypothetical protein